MSQPLMPESILMCRESRQVDLRRIGRVAWRLIDCVEDPLRAVERVDHSYHKLVYMYPRPRHTPRRAECRRRRRRSARWAPRRRDSAGRARKKNIVRQFCRFYQREMRNKKYVTLILAGAREKKTCRANSGRRSRKNKYVALILAGAREKINMSR